MGKLSELQKVELDILQEFSRAARREGLVWFVMFGTLLGAVREKGFLPWDEDIDIAVPRADYDRLRLSQGWFSEPYFLQTPHNDQAAAPRYMRLRRSDTAVLINFPGRLTCGGHMGACIDIFPLDDVPDGAHARKLSRMAGQLQCQMLATAALDECEKAHMTEGKLGFCYYNGGVAGLYSLFADRYEEICTGYSGTPYYAIPAMSGGRGGRVYEKEWFADSITMEFEGMSVPAPAGWKEALLVSYPDGLHEPAAKDRKVKHAADCIIDTHRSYQDYVRKYTDMLCGIEGKKVYIFGAGDSLRIWLERYGKGLDVVCAVDNDKTKWGGSAYGIPVCSPSELPGMPDENTRIIIASIWHKDISKQLEKIGIMNYYIFIDGWGYKREG